MAEGHTCSDITYLRITLYNAILDTSSILKVDLFDALAQVLCEDDQVSIQLLHV